MIKKAESTTSWDTGYNSQSERYEWYDDTYYMERRARIVKRYRLVEGDKEGRND